MDRILACLFLLLLTETMATGRIECDPRNPHTIPVHPNINRNLMHFPGIYYGGNLICELTCHGYCDASPARNPMLYNAFKCQCPLGPGGCDENGPITDGRYTRCKKAESGHCDFKPNHLQPPDLTYECYQCSMLPFNWSSFYACCPVPMDEEGSGGGDNNNAEEDPNPS